MTETEKKALALVNEAAFNDEPWTLDDVRGGVVFKALCRAIEQHEAFRQEVSEAIDSSVLTPETEAHLSRFIIPKPDEVSAGLALAIEDTLELVIGDEDVSKLRAALAARGLEVRKIGEGE